MHPQHRRVEDMVELIDVYPTAAVLSGLPVPPHVDGRVISALFEDTTGEATNITAAAFSQYPRCPQPGDVVPHHVCYELPSSNFTYMGFSVRTANWRYTEWRHWDGAQLRGIWEPAGLIATELYNHTGHFADSIS